MCAALAEISGEPYAFPLSRLQRILRVDVKECRPVQGRQQLLLDGHSVGLISAAEILGLPELQTAGGLLSVIVLGEGEQLYGLMVDRFLGEQGLVVRPLDSRLGRVPHISSAAITEAGQPLLIVDVEDLLCSMQQHSGRRPASRPAVSPSRPSQRGETGACCRRLVNGSRGRTAVAQGPRLRGGRRG